MGNSKKQKPSEKQIRKATLKLHSLKTLRIGRLNSLEKVASLQSRIIKQGIKGDGIEVKDAYNLVSACQMLAKVLESIENKEILKRVEAIEKNQALINKSVGNL
jgi:endonuclease V-like protein UPF0215 family